jgi:hypothetical protein
MSMIFHFYLCTSLGIIKPGYRGTVGDKLVNGWTRLTHSCCRKNWTQASTKERDSGESTEEMDSGEIADREKGTPSGNRAAAYRKN